MDRTDRVLGSILITIIAAFVLQAAVFEGGSIAGAIVSGGDQPAGQPSDAAPDAPDLTVFFFAAQIDGISMPAVDGTLSVPAGKRARLLWQASNRGNAGASAANGRYSFAGNSYPLAPTPFLSPGQQIFIPLDFDCSTPGLFTIETAVDYGQTIKESDEENNAASIIVFCQ